MWAQHTPLNAGKEHTILCPLRIWFRASLGSCRAGWLRPDKGRFPFGMVRLPARNHLQTRRKSGSGRHFEKRRRSVVAIRPCCRNDTCRGFVECTRSRCLASTRSPRLLFAEAQCQQDAGSATHRPSFKVISGVEIPLVFGDAISGVRADGRQPDGHFDDSKIVAC